MVQRIRDKGLRTIKTNYLARRLETEAWLIQEKQRLLGATTRLRPIYYFVGDFADGRDRSRPASLVMLLSAFPQEVITFTYPDSMASFALARGSDEKRVHYGHVFSLESIRQVVAQLGMPSNDATRAERYIEMQVWDDGPIRQWIDRRASQKFLDRRMPQAARDLENASRDPPL